MFYTTHRLLRTHIQDFSEAADYRKVIKRKVSKLKYASLVAPLETLYVSYFPARAIVAKLLCFTRPLFDIILWKKNNQM